MSEKLHQMNQLHAFLSENGITMNGISIQQNDMVGMYVRAEKKLLENEVVATIPKSAVLSTKNTAIADILQEYEIGGLLGLTLALMFEIAKGSASPWYEYIKALPKKVEIPLLWDSNELVWLHGTELGDSVIQDQVALREDYESIILPILNEPIFSPSDEFTFEKFQHASSLVSSRAFNVDDYHKQSMVPLADIFNHVSNENVHFQCNSNVCEFCGESGICDCEIIDHVSSMDNILSEDMKSDCPPLVECQSVAGNDEEEDDMGLMEMIVVRACDAKKEVYNTYGQHSNSYLLNRYGFCEENNPFDAINFYKEDILDLLKALPIQLLSKRIVMWEKWGRKGCSKLQNMLEIQRELDVSEEEMEQYIEEENDESFDDGFYLDYKLQPSFPLYCFLQLMLMQSSALTEFARDRTKYEKLIEKSAYRKWHDEEDSLKMAQSMGQIVYILCKNKLAKYPTTLFEDLELYETIRGTDQQKLKNALILRISDKRILQGFLDDFDSY